MADEIWAKDLVLGLAEAGADVAVADLQIDDGRLQAVADEITDMGGAALLQVDISSKTSVDELVAEVVESLGGIDILMNVAVMYHRKSLPELDEDGWDRLTDVNLK